MTTITRVKIINFCDTSIELEREINKFIENKDVKTIQYGYSKVDNYSAMIVYETTI